ncbi:hypothetical protein M9H77_36282 [Catharanthus roseus]|uniref:Uncharacterized protein n=1 Tax=Catharanthus roseus TaxID=4058 RepID=A0ACB9ZTK2_CATRO|nr:hypothetical protein M9H77_36282 [Catharanthus roseus]
MLFFAATTLVGRLGLFMLGGVHPSLAAKEDIIIMACVFPFISLPDRKYPLRTLSIIRGSDSLGQQLIDRWGWDFNVRALAGLVHKFPVKRVDKRRRQRLAGEKGFLYQYPVNKGSECTNAYREESDSESNLVENEQSIWATGDKTTSLDNKKGTSNHLIIIV